MISFKSVALSAVALLGLSLTLSLKADNWNKKTTLTVKEAIQLPNTVLQPGTYVFKLSDSMTYRHIVQIFNADESQIIATILAIPNYRLKPTDKSVFGFWGKLNFGQEFAYPKMKAIEIAKVTRTPVPTVIVEKEVLKTAPIVIVTEKGEEKPLVLLAQNTPIPTIARTAPEAAYLPPVVVAKAAQTLPATASSLPLMGLAGLASLGAFGLLVCLPKRKFGLINFRRS